MPTNRSYKDTLFTIICAIVVCLIVASMVMLFLSGNKVSEKKELTKAKLNNGKKWKIAYYEGGNYRTYRPTLIGFLEGLATYGWVKKFDSLTIPEDKDDKGDTKAVWLWACDNVKSDYIEFSKVNFWSSGWLASIEEDNKKLVSNYGQTKVFDLILAMGTRAGLSLINPENKFPIFLLSVTDPVEAGIFKNDLSTGYDNVFTVYDPDRVTRCLKLFHELIPFKKLGVVLSLSAVTGSMDIHKSAKDLGFTVASCTYKSANPNYEEVVQSYRDCIDQLLKENIDAFYFTTILGLSKATLPEFLPRLSSGKIPSASFDSALVETGVLLSYGMSGDYNEAIGKLAAENAIKVFKGTSPGKLKNPYDRVPLGLVVNLKTAKGLGLTIPEGILQTASKTYK